MRSRTIAPNRSMRPFVKRMENRRTNSRNAEATRARETNSLPTERGALAHGRTSYSSPPSRRNSVRIAPGQQLRGGVTGNQWRREDPKTHSRSDGPQAAHEPRQERALLPAAQRLARQHRRVPRQRLQQLPPAGVPPEHPLLVARLPLQRPPRRRAPVAAGDAMPHHRGRLVHDLEAEPPQPERQVHVLEVRPEVLREPARREEGFAPVERGTRGGPEDPSRRAGGVSPLFSSFALTNRG